MRHLPSTVAGLYSGSAAAAEHQRLTTDKQALPGLFLMVDAAGRITDSLVAGEGLLRTPGERIVGRRIQRVLFVEMAALISEVLKSTSESGLSIHVEYDQEIDSGGIRLHARFTRVHGDRL